MTSAADVLWNSFTIMDPYVVVRLAVSRYIVFGHRVRVNGHGAFRAFSA